MRRKLTEQRAAEQRLLLWKSREAVKQMGGALHYEMGYSDGT